MIKCLVKARDKNPGSELVIAKSRGFNHPVIALWKTDINDKLLSALNEGVRKIDLFTTQLKKVYVDFDEEGNSEFDYFTNLNSPHDLILAQQILGTLPPLFGVAVGPDQAKQPY